MEMARKIFDQLLLSNFMKIRYWCWICYVLVFIQSLMDRAILEVNPQERECEGCHSLTGLLHFRCLTSNSTASLCFPDAVSSFSYR